MASKDYRESRIRKRVASLPWDTMEKVQEDVARFQKVWEDIGGDDWSDDDFDPCFGQSRLFPRSVKLTGLSSKGCSPPPELEEEDSSESESDVDCPSQSGGGDAEKEVNATSERELKEEGSNSKGDVGPSTSNRSGKRRRSSSSEGVEEGPPEIPPVGYISEGVYQLEKVVDARVKVREGIPFVGSSGLDYRVKWKGWPEEFNSWEPEENVAELAEDAKSKFWENQCTQSQNKNQMKASQVLTTEAPAMARILAAAEVVD